VRYQINQGFAMYNDKDKMGSVNSSKEELGVNGKR
jgi:hypothetical protein